MDINGAIQNNLIKWRDDSINDFKLIDNPHPLFTDCFIHLKEIDPESIKAEMFEELTNSCLEDWIEPSNNFNHSTSMQAIEFNYNYNFVEQPYASAFGFCFETFKIKTIPYEKEYDITFVPGLEGMSGISLRPLEFLNKLIEYEESAAENYDISDQDGYLELINSYLYTSFTLLHDTLYDFVKSEAFSKIKRAKNFQFLITEYNFDALPIYYLFENEKEKKRLIQIQKEPLDNKRESYFRDLRGRIQTLIFEEDESQIGKILSGLYELLDHKENKSNRGFAAYQLYRIYEFGKGIPQNSQKAIEYLELSVKYGNNLAKGRLAEYYYLGTYKEKNLQKSLDLLSTIDSMYMNETSGFLLLKKKIIKEMEQQN